jgi:hypothetical protein
MNSCADRRFRTVVKIQLLNIAAGRPSMLLFRLLIATLRCGKYQSSRSWRLITSSDCSFAIAVLKTGKVELECFGHTQGA